MATQEQLDEVQQLFARGGEARRRAMEGGLRGSKVRSLVWRVTTGALPEVDGDDGVDALVREWPGHAEGLRREYEALKAELVVNPDDAAAAADDVVFDPLGAGGAGGGGNDPWAEFHKDKELLEDISKDLNRLYPSGCGDFFTQEPVAEILKQALFVWCKLHADTSYRQGMHELAAPILYCLYQEAIPSRKRKGGGDDSRGKLDAALQVVMDMAYLEHDLFWVFERVMRDMKPLFVVAKGGKMTQKQIQRAKQALIKQRREEQAGAVRQTAGPGAAGAADPGLTPVLQLSQRIQGELLRTADSALSRHLAALDVEPQLYALRWLRLLFGREFAMADTMVIWDGLFAEAFPAGRAPQSARQVRDAAQAFARVDCSATPVDCGLPGVAAFLAVAMLMHARESLLVDDHSSALQVLMRYPPVEDVHMLVAVALSLRAALTRSSSPALGGRPPVTAPARPTTEPSPSKPIRPAAPPKPPVPTTTAAAAATSAATAAGGAFRRVKTQLTAPVRGLVKGTVPAPSSAGERDASGSPLGEFFKDLGEKIENIFEGDERAAAAPQGLQQRMGTRLQGIVGRMELALGGESGATGLAEHLAELKRVRDVLLGRVPEAEAFGGGGGGAQDRRL